MEQELFTLADELKELRETKKYAEQELKEINADIEKVEASLSERMVNTETQSFSRAGTLFYLTTKTQASSMIDKKEELYEALRENDYGDLIYETVNANSLSAFVKEQIAENGDTLPEWLEGLVNVFEKTTVGIRKSK